jgi:hypothetical protein
LGWVYQVLLLFLFEMKNKNQIIGRSREQRVLSECCKSDKAELVAVYGRRRVGKTYLVRNFFHDQFDFYFTGTFKTARNIQLKLFASELTRYSGKSAQTPADWFEAFSMLWNYLATLKKKRIVVFLDELPWMDSPKSNLLQAFSYFWNSRASAMPQLKIFVCGSATSWMLSKLIGDRGGLHGRVTRQIYLRQFNLAETAAFLKHKGIVWNRYQIAQTYMILGGIPYYLDMLDPAQPFDGNFDSLFYAEGAPLRAEYNFIFRSLFGDSELCDGVVKALARKNIGMTQAELAEAVHAEQSGKLTKVLNNLCACDFLRTYKAFGKKNRERMYQLYDLYSLFYLKFVANSSGQDQHFWSNMRDNPSRRAWEGYAFEQLCLHHIDQIRASLGIGGVLCEVCSWQSRPYTDQAGTRHKGAQIDLLIDRRDDVIDLCEMKFSSYSYAITADYDERLRERAEEFRAATGTKKALHIVFVAANGVSENKYSGNVQNVVTLDDLFRKQL